MGAQMRHLVDVKARLETTQTIINDDAQHKFFEVMPGNSNRTNGRLL